MNRDLIDNLLKSAFSEDIGDGDHSTLACIPKEAEGRARLLVKERGIVAGVEVAVATFNYIDPTLHIDINVKDGEAVKPGDIVFSVAGRVHSILVCERTVLNLMQRMSGIATTTHSYVELLKGLNTKILDTRKTTPTLRFLEKEAVKIGGGENHRMGLYDMIMLKDNHIDFAGGIEKAILKTQQYLSANNKNLKIVIEVRSLDEVAQVLRVGGVNRLLLDNFNLADTAAAVKMIAGRYETESSGGITGENLRSYAECGVDYVSMGVLTHHVSSLDLSLKADMG